MPISAPLRISPSASASTWRLFSATGPHHDQGWAMKVEARDADRFSASPPKALRAALVFGPDAGLVQERAERLMKSVVPDLSDPFNISDLSEAVLDADPARLRDEAAALSM